MKSFFLFLLFLCSHPVWSRNIVLLSSLELSATKIKKMETIFSREFKTTGHRLIVVHRARPSDLRAHLLSDQTDALLWVSHSAKEVDLKAGISGDEIILDVWGNDVKKFFTAVHPGVRFVGVVGCQAESILEGFRNRGYYQENANLQLKSFKKKVDLFGGLRKTLKAAKTVLETPAQPSANGLSSGERFTFMRAGLEPQAKLSSGWVELADTIVAFFGEGEAQPTSVSAVPPDIWGRLKLKNLKYIRDKSSDEGFTSLGRIDLLESSIADGEWRLFADKEGRPLGGGHQQLLIYKAR